MSANPLTRRQWAAALAAASAVAPQVPAQSNPQQGPEQLLEEARAAVRYRRDAMARFKLPMETEPVTVFRA